MTNTTINTNGCENSGTNRVSSDTPIPDSKYNHLEEEDEDIDDNIRPLIPNELHNLQDPNVQNIPIHEIGDICKEMRLDEWLHFTRDVLYNRLTSGFAKFGSIELPSCPYPLAKEFLLKQQCYTYCKRYQRKSDGERCKRRYFEFKNLPDLGADEDHEYFIRNHNTDVHEARSMYVTLTFVVQKDSRVKCSYTQVSQVRNVNLNRWYDVA